MSSFRIFTPTCKTDLNLCGKSITLNFTLENDWDYAAAPKQNAIIISTTTADPKIAPVYNGIVFNIPTIPPLATAGYKFTSYISQKSIKDDELYYVIVDKNTEDVPPDLVPFPVNSSSCVTNTVIENLAPPSP